MARKAIAGELPGLWLKKQREERMKAKCFLAALAALVLLFSVSAVQAQQAAAAAPGVKADVAILRKDNRTLG